MGFLDLGTLSGIDIREFRERQPYPWANPHGALTPEGLGALADSLPDVERFEKVFGKKRKYGQASHDRYTLEYEPGMELTDTWRGFVNELLSAPYTEFVADLLGSSRFELRFHWHYTPRGCSVSPHCDARRKLGSHIFYMMRAEEWDASWGGETVVLDDGGRFHSDSAPRFEDFDRVFPARAGENDSFIFARRGDSWHGVRTLTCPPGTLRKVFIVVFERSNAFDKAKAWFVRPKRGGY
jgi:hypothetical protein